MTQTCESNFSVIMVGGLYTCTCIWCFVVVTCTYVCSLLTVTCRCDY